ncbi:MAG: thermonuclease family protein [Alphaproteobacteria bacterium]
MPPRPPAGDWLKVAILALAAVLAAAPSRAEDTAVVRGAAAVIDATHLDIAGRRFKLYGIDAPDIDETCSDAAGKDYPCGIQARAALAELIKDGTVACLPRGVDQSNEPLGACSVGKLDLAQALIDAGWAIADRARTLYYEKAEEQARTTQHGLWQGPFVPPAAWRAGERVPQSHTGGTGIYRQKLF